jgi:multiple antibiotic resistance protein
MLSMLEQLNSFIALWVMIDPIAALPIFVSITGEFDRRDSRKTAVVAIVVSFFILCFFIAVVKIILEAMGVSLRDFQIAGGLILFLLAASMVMGDGQEGPEPRSNHKNTSALAVHPLAVPTLAGPGAMLTVMLLTDNSRFTIMDQLLTTATLAVVLAVTLAMLLFAHPITRVIGVHGANVVKRIMGMILAAVAVKIVLGGVSDWLHLPRDAL